MFGKGDEEELTGEHDGGDVKVGRKKKRKLISADGATKKHKGKKGKRKSHGKKAVKK